MISTKLSQQCSRRREKKSKAWKERIFIWILIKKTNSQFKNDLPSAWHFHNQKKRCYDYLYQFKMSEVVGHFIQQFFAVRLRNILVCSNLLHEGQKRHESRESGKSTSWLTVSKSAKLMLDFCFYLSLRKQVIFCSSLKLRIVSKTGRLGSLATYLKGMAKS